MTSPSMAWSRSELESRDSWHCEVPRAVVDEFAAAVARDPQRFESVDGYRHDASLLPRLVDWSHGVQESLLREDGVQLIRGLASEIVDPEARRLFYLALGCALGKPMTQYGRMFEVKDRGKDHTKENVPVSMTAAPTGFHTDSSSRDVVPDFVGLLCERASDEGGDSLVSNALRVQRILEEQAPGELALLQRDFVRDVVTPGVPRSQEGLLRNRFPVFGPTARPEGTVFRYMRYWIETGQEKAGRPLSAAELRALDILDELLADEANVVQFRMEPGDILFVNNRTMAHNRTGYRDAPESAGRLLHRMWVRVPLQDALAG